MARFLFVIIGLFAFALPAAAQRETRPGEPTLRDLPFDLTPRTPRQDDGPRGRTPSQPSDTSTKNTAKPAPLTLDGLYEGLAKAKDRREASAIEKQIERRWARSGSETADLLLARANIAANAKEQETALELYDHIILLKPEWAEAYHRRATLFFTMNDHESAVRDLHMALQKEPRHFSALSGLGMILQQSNHKKAALAAYRKALELNPTMDNLKRLVDRLEPEVDGVKL